MVAIFAQHATDFSFYGMGRLNTHEDKVSLEMRQALNPARLIIKIINDGVPKRKSDEGLDLGLEDGMSKWLVQQGLMPQVCSRIISPTPIHRWFLLEISRRDAVRIPTNIIRVGPSLGLHFVKLRPTGWKHVPLLLKGLLHSSQDDVAELVKSWEAVEEVILVEPYRIGEAAFSGQWLIVVDLQPPTNGEPGEETEAAGGSRSSVAPAAEKEDEGMDDDAAEDSGNRKGSAKDPGEELSAFSWQCDPSKVILQSLDHRFEARFYPDADSQEWPEYTTAKDMAPDQLPPYRFATAFITNAFACAVCGDCQHHESHCPVKPTLGKDVPLGRLFGPHDGGDSSDDEQPKPKGKGKGRGKKAGGTAGPTAGGSRQEPVAGPSTAPAPPEKEEAQPSRKRARAFSGGNRGTYKKPKGRGSGHK